VWGQVGGPTNTAWGHLEGSNIVWGVARNIVWGVNDRSVRAASAGVGGDR